MFAHFPRHVQLVQATTIELEEKRSPICLSLAVRSAPITILSPWRHVGSLGQAGGTSPVHKVQMLLATVVVTKVNLVN